MRFLHKLNERAIKQFNYVAKNGQNNKKKESWRWIINEFDELN